MLSRLLLGLALSVVLIGCDGAEGGAQDTAASDQDRSPTGAAVGEETAAGGTATAEVEIGAMNGSGVTGTATFEQITGGIEVELDARGLPRPETVYLAHVHRGACAEAGRKERVGGGTDHPHEGGVRHDHRRRTDAGDHDHAGAGDIEQPLSPVRSDLDGRGSSTTVLWDTTVDELFSGDPKYVNVHAAGQGYPPPLACGDLERAG